MAPEIPDNYLIRDNASRIDLKPRLAIEIGLSMWEILHVALRSSSASASDLVETRNFFEKNYIRPEYQGSASIYYTIRSRETGFFGRRSFSLPIYVTYPIYGYDDGRGLLLGIAGGTNALAPDRIGLDAEQGWDRFDELTASTKTDLGVLKQTEWFAGVTIAGPALPSLHLGCQLLFVYTNYNVEFNVPLRLQSYDKTRLSFRLSAIKVFRL